MKDFQLIPTIVMQTTTLMGTEQIISQAKLNIEEFMLYFKDTDNAVNYMNEYSGLIHLAIYRAMVKEGCKYQREMRDFISA